MRTIFNGNRVPVADVYGQFYFYFGAPLVRGRGDHMAILTAWVRTYDAYCRSLLPDNPNTLKTEYLETRGPYFRRMTRLTGTDVLRFQPGLMKPYIKSRNAMQARLQQQLKGQQSQMLGQIVKGGVVASGIAAAYIEPYLHALDDFDKFFTLVGCDSPTARQMSQGIYVVANDASLPFEATEAWVSGAEWVSDKPQGPGEYRLHSEICWEYQYGHNSCGCLVDLAAQRMNESTPMSVTIPYTEVHKAFMSGPDIDKKVCRSPLKTIGLR